MRRALSFAPPPRPSQLPGSSRAQSAMSDVASVCVCAQAGDVVRVLPCFHRFHASEIDDWLSRNTTCPLCHLDVNEALTG